MNGKLVASLAKDGNRIYIYSISKQNLEIGLYPVEEIPITVTKGPTP